MSLNTIILKNFFKSLKNYALYIFALIFSVVLYFSFVLMLQDDSVATELQSEAVMSTGFTVGSVLLMVIIILFVMFANSIFLKRRNKELALLQLIGLRRKKLLRILVLENAVIYFGSLVSGITLGFLVSRMLLMILLRMMQIELTIGMSFSVTAVIQTSILFACIFALLMAQNFIFLKRTRLVDMLKLNQSIESDYRGIRIWTIAGGVLGLAMIISGYWLSMNIMEFGTLLVPVLLGILFLTIVGTYLLFKSSVAFVLNLIRQSKNGHLNVKDVLSLTSIMFKMKSNAFLLTLISVISALSMGLMSFSYISYYSVEQSVDASVSNDYVFYEEEDMEFYSGLLDENEVAHESRTIPLLMYDATGEGITITTPQGGSETILAIVSEEFIEDVSVDENEMVIKGLSTTMSAFMDFELDSKVTLFNDDYEQTVELVGVDENAILPPHVARGALQAVVSQEVYSTLENNYTYDEEIAAPQESYAIDITGEDSQDIFELMNQEGYPLFESRINQYNSQMQGAGIMMFVIGFVGLAFLMTTGCILYFKQVGEGEDEKGSYTILRKLGFSVGELVKGLTVKVGLTFGIPLLMGLLHTYFAVNAGWFIFGSKMWVPMLTVMVGYVFLYLIFACFSLLHYKKIVRESI